MTPRDCESIRPLISAALDGELDENEFVRLSEHLASCADCHQTYQDYSQLRDNLRTAPAPVPPSHLTRSIREETVEKPPPPLVVQLASRAGLRFGATTVVASLVILFALGALGYLGYDRQTPPAIAGSQPTTQEEEVVQDWPVRQPIEIEFSKRMNKKSVERNLIIKPTSEAERLPTSWDGNTLIIGHSKNNSVLLRPNTDYTIVILENAEDRHGNLLGDIWVLKFRTSPQEVAINTPSPDNETPEDTASAEQELDGDSSPTAESPTNTAEGESGQSNPPTGGNDVDESEVDTEEPDPTEPEPTDEPQEEPTEAEPTEEPDEQDDETPQPTATPKPTDSGETESDSGAESTPTETPEQEPTAEPTEPVIAAEDSNDSSNTIPVRGPFGEVYWGNPAVQDKLGNPLHEAMSFIAAEQEFQRGLMFRGYHQDSNAIYVFINGSKVRTFNFDFDPGVDNYPGEQLDDGLYAPAAYFGKIWAENDDISESLGSAISQNAAENIDGAIQQFNYGQMIYSRGMVYVIDRDGAWESYPVRSGDSGYQDDDGTGEGDQPDEGTGGESTPEAGEDENAEDTDESDLQATPEDESSASTPTEQEQQEQEPDQGVESDESDDETTDQ